MKKLIRLYCLMKTINRGMIKAWIGSVVELTGVGSSGISQENK